MENCFQSLGPLRAILPEILWEENNRNSTVFEGILQVLLSRFKDNLYIVLLLIPQDYLSFVRHSISILLCKVDGIALKWKPEGSLCDWGGGIAVVWYAYW